MKQLVYCYVSALLFTVVAIAHFIRLINGWSVQINGTDIPLTVSWFGVAIPAILAFWGYQTAKHAGD